MSLRSLLLASALALGVVCAPQAARAACGSIPYTFTNLVSTVDANSTNSNNNHFQSCATNVDNTQVGTAGFFASQLIPTGITAAIFGGSFGYTFWPNSSGQVPLTIAGATSQSVDIWDVCLLYASGCSSKVIWIDSAGLFHFGTTNATLNSGSGVPGASCSPGAVYSNTSATNITNLLYGCVATNTWQPLSPGSAGTVGFTIELFQTLNVSLATQTPPLTSQGSGIGIGGTYNSPQITNLYVHCDTAAVGGTNNTVQIYREALGGSYATIGSALSWTTAKDASVSFTAVTLSTQDVLELGISSVDTTPPKNCVFYVAGTQNA